MNKRLDVELTLVNKLSVIQQSLNAPKGQFNSFGKYNYRSCEDILMAVKPLLGGLILTVNDEMVLVGDRIYVKATASISDGHEIISTSAYAREAESKKGMDEAQVTGSTSSYARKYALNGLLLIDDNKDADSTNKHGKDNEAEAFAKKATESKVTPTAGALESFNADEQKFLMQFAEGIQEHFNQQSATPNELVDMLEKQHLEPEEKIAVWSLLDSKCRTAIKKAKEAMTMATQA